MLNAGTDSLRAAGFSARSAFLTSPTFGGISWLAHSTFQSGLWISNGELTYPVEEITVAGNLKDLFFNISEIASDLEFRGSVAAPTMRIDGLIVGGE